MMTKRAIQTRVYGMRRRQVRGHTMAHFAAVRGAQIRSEVTPRAVPCYPVRPVAARRRFIVAANAEVLPVARRTPLAVSAGRKPVAQRPPGVRVVARGLRSVACRAVVPHMAGKACVVPHARPGQIPVKRLSVIAYPVAAVRTGLRKRDSSLVGEICVRTAAAVARIAGGLARARRRRLRQHKKDGKGGQDGSETSESIRTHSTCPHEESGTFRGRPRIHNGCRLRIPALRVSCF
jgi:hypothetical protein